MNSPTEPQGPAIPATTKPVQPADDPFQDQLIEDDEETDPFDETIIEWTGPEFIYNPKPLKWYVILLGSMAVLAVIVMLLTHDWMTGGSLIIIGIFLAVMGAKKPRITTFRLDGHGLIIGHKHYAFDQFRSFAPMIEHGVPSVSFYPLQRFMPWITIYHAPADAERIQDMLTTHLPLEERTHDYLDQLLHKIKL